MVGAQGLLENEFPVMTGWLVDPDFIATLGLEMVSGREFTKVPNSSEDYDYILNENAAARIGWSAQDALGKALNLHGRKGRVVGVVKDFNFASLHTEIEPLVLFVEPRGFQYLLLKMTSTDIAGVMQFVESKWHEFVPHRPFEFAFLDQTFDALYRTEQRMQQFFLTFATLAIGIACLGLFGLASFTAEQRTKEVGIRKVLGASIGGIVLLLSKDFTRFVLWAILIASPIAYFVMQSWLEDFAYRIDIGMMTFFAAGLMALTIALLTVGYQTAKAALSNPIKALRYE